jgi:hypothetical protein
VHSSTVDISQIVNYLITRFKVISDTIEDEDARFETVQDVIKNPHSGLSRTESSILLRTLLNSNDKSDNIGVETINSSKLSNKENIFDLKYILDSNKRESSKQRINKIITDIRRSSIMRSLLNKVNHNELFVSLSALLDNEAKDTNVSCIIDKKKYIAANNCFNVLEKCNLFNLQRHQIICIMSWAPCYDDSHKYVDISEFSEYASKIIGNILQGELSMARADMMEQDCINDNIVMDKISFENIELYYRKSFEEIESEEGYVEMDKFIEVVTNTPNVNLSNTEVGAILSQFEHNSKGVHW